MNFHHTVLQGQDFLLLVSFWQYSYSYLLYHSFVHGQLHIVYLGPELLPSFNSETVSTNKHKEKKMTKRDLLTKDSIVYQILVTDYLEPGKESNIRILANGGIFP